MSGPGKRRGGMERKETQAQRAAVRMMGGVHAVFGIVFVLIAITQILPAAGLFAAPFIAAGSFFAINGIRMISSQKEEGEETPPETGVPLQMGQGPGGPAGETHDHIPSIALGPQKRLEQLETLKQAGLITEEEYRNKRGEILREL